MKNLIIFLLVFIASIASANTNGYSNSPSDFEIIVKKYNIPKSEMQRLCVSQMQEVIELDSTITLAATIVALGQTNISDEKKKRAFAKLKVAVNHTDEIERIAKEYRVLNNLKNIKRQVAGSIDKTQKFMDGSSFSFYYLCINFSTLNILFDLTKNKINNLENQNDKFKLSMLYKTLRKGEPIPNEDVPFLRGLGLHKIFASIECFNSIVISMGGYDKIGGVELWELYKKVQKEKSIAQTKMREGRALLMAKSSTNKLDTGKKSSLGSSYGLGASVDNSKANARGAQLIKEGEAILKKIEDVKFFLENYNTILLKKDKLTSLKSKQGNQEIKAVVLEYRNGQVAMINAQSQKNARFDAKKNLSSESIKVLESGKF